jgi:hypothetical protein
VADAEPTPEQLAEQLRALKISDLVLSTVSTLGQLTYVKIQAKELDEARLAIDATAALLPLLEGHAEAQILREFNQLLANVRIAYTSAASQPPPEPPSEPQPPETASEGESDAGGDG